MTTDPLAMFETLQKVVDHPVLKLVARGAMALSLVVAGAVWSTIHGVTTRMDTVETVSAEVRKDVDAIDRRTIDRAQQNDEFQEDVRQSLGSMQARLLDMAVDVATTRGILEEIRRRDVALRSLPATDGSVISLALPE